MTSETSLYFHLGHSESTRKIHSVGRPFQCSLPLSFISLEPCCGRHWTLPPPSITQRLFISKKIFWEFLLRVDFFLFRLIHWINVHNSTGEQLYFFRLESECRDHSQQVYPQQTQLMSQWIFWGSLGVVKPDLWINTGDKLCNYVYRNQKRVIEPIFLLQNLSELLIVA